MTSVPRYCRIGLTDSALRNLLRDTMATRDQITADLAKLVQFVHCTNKPIPKLRKAPQPPMSHRGAAPDSDRAKKPPLTEPAASGEELNPGDLVEGLGDCSLAGVLTAVAANISQL